jgi:hypothetical protein
MPFPRGDSPGHWKLPRWGGRTSQLEGRPRARWHSLGREGRTEQQLHEKQITVSEEENIGKERKTKPEKERKRSHVFCEESLQCWWG